ncbi:hypothetical protein CAOG_01430 [Capsaspora owczarzaki ATCC 30864]|uniref:Uncharacterized protein n=1 Tax=Capsaspora owczarzaki (strain ATCC 30864) TaxID=595528 RepID=A0A0D2X122_CAPO3|nr:hypothetical protein CAOG_01430 [Capsaspora owczarzaki ATCC 30864]KJE90054.1 hypothetical protein CAOG_001430 [Capsaspora owczarzaki ATCC 30864]|eukprot:XP_004349950.1 hypothetical protein CAOG_01430 [Capsaspora owczarzaki ATCC 30864]
MKFKNLFSSPAAAGSSSTTASTTTASTATSTTATSTATSTAAGASTQGSVAGYSSPSSQHEANGGHSPAAGTTHSAAAAAAAVATTATGAAGLMPPSVSGLDASSPGASGTTSLRDSTASSYSSSSTMAVLQLVCERLDEVAIIYQELAAHLAQGSLPRPNSHADQAASSNSPSNHNSSSKSSGGGLSAPSLPFKRRTSADANAAHMVSTSKWFVPPPEAGALASPANTAALTVPAAAAAASTAPTVVPKLSSDAYSSSCVMCPDGTVLAQTDVSWVQQRDVLSIMHDLKFASQQFGHALDEPECPVLHLTGSTNIISCYELNENFLVVNCKMTPQQLETFDTRQAQTLVEPVLQDIKQLLERALPS